VIHTDRQIEDFAYRKQPFGDAWLLADAADGDGYDGAKKLSGRKRHPLVDTLGLALGVLVHPANIPARAAAPAFLWLLQPARPRLESMKAGNGCLGPPQTWVWDTFGWRVPIVERPGGRGRRLRAGQSRPIWPAGIQPLLRR
jgi:hypothetical protein